MEKQQQDGIGKASWGRAADFFVTMLGFAVGLGNVWRFPNVVYKYGGGAFFIPYVIAIVVIGVPLFLLESSIGQYSRKNSVEVWDISPVFRGVGIASCFVISMINVYYTTPQAWALFYFASSMAPQLPWAECNAPWASANCSNLTSAEEYFYQEVIKVSSGLTDWGDLNWQLLLCNMGIWIVIFAAVSYGAASLGKVAYFTSLFPYAMLTAMLVFTLLLEGSGEGITYYLLPEPSKIADIRVWSVAVSQVFFSTGLGCGVVAQMSSYNKFNHNILRDAILVPLSDALTSFFAGFSVFAVLGYMSVVQNKPVPEVVTAGPGLIFITYPEAFTKMPGGQVWAVFFFFMTCILGLSSSVPSVESVCAVLADYIVWFKGSRLRNVLLRFCVCLAGFLVGFVFYFGNGFYSYSLIDDRVIGYSLMVIGIVETAAISWFYGPKRLLSNIDEMVGGWKRFRFMQYYFITCWTVLCPAGILFILLLDIIDFTGMKVLDYVFPDWAIAIGWALVAVSPLLIVTVAVLTLCDCYRCYKLCWLVTQPSKAWQRRDDAYEAPSPPPKYVVHTADSIEPTQVDAIAQPPPNYGYPQNPQGYTNNVFIADSPKY